MKSVLQIFLLMAILLPLEAMNARAQAVDYQVYENNKLGFTVSYPKGWKKVDAPGGYKTAVQFSAGADPHAPSFYVGANPPDSDDDLPVSTPEQYVNDHLNNPSLFALRSSPADSRVIRQGIMRLSNQPAFFIEYASWEDKSWAERTYQVSTIKNGTYYTILLTAPIKDFLREWKTFEFMLNSIDLHPALAQRHKSTKQQPQKRRTSRKRRVI